MKKILLYLILIMAIGLAGTVAYVSVTGLLKVFTGAGTAGLIFFIAIEVGKVVATSTIHTYGKQIGWFYNILLSLGIFIAMAITSMGIYGFLSSSYKESFAKMENVDSQVELLETKRDSYQEQLDFVVKEKETLNKTIGELSSGLSNNVIQYRDPVSGEIITTTSSSTRRALEKQLDNAIVRQTTINAKADSLSTVIFNVENEILETKLGNDAANELGTLQYLSDITGASMDTVMSWFIFLLIIIGDPMAVLMVIVFNKVVNNHKEDKETPPAPTDGPTDVNSFENIDRYMKPEIKISEDTGEIELPEEQLPIETDFILPSPVDEVEELPEEVQNIVDQYDVPVKVTEIIEEPTPITEDEVVDSADTETTIEEQVEENINEIKELTREPVIPRGEILKEDLIQDQDRGFSVKIPNPKEDTKKSHFFPRKRPNELGDV